MKMKMSMKVIVSARLQLSFNRSDKKRLSFDKSLEPCWNTN